MGTPREWPAAMQDHQELEDLLQVIRDIGAKKILEIGTCGGGTAAAMASTGAVVTTMDIVEMHPYPWETDEYKAEFPNAVVNYLKADSRPWYTPPKVQDDYDLVFIDADHTDFSQYTDFKNYACMGKVVAVHDTNQWATRTQDDWFPRNFWRLVMQDGTYVTKEIQSPTNLGGLGGIGIVYLRPGDYQKLLKMFEAYLFSK
jgi:protein-L-isoaspartate O-methyltransferase